MLLSPLLTRPMTVPDYETLRFERLANVVAEYMDEEVAAALFLSDLRKALLEWRDYHRKELAKSEEVLGAVDQNWIDGCM